VEPSRRTAAIALTCSIAVVSGAASAGVAAHALSTLNDVVNERSSGMVNTRAFVSANPATVDAVLSDPAFDCQLLPGCTDGSKKGRRVTANIKLPTGDQPVRIKLGKQVPGKSLTFSYSTKSRLGAASAEALINLKPSGTGTVVEYRTQSAKSSGALGRVMTTGIGSQIRDAIGRAGEAFASVQTMQYPMGVSLAKVPMKVKSGKKIRITPSYWIETPTVTAPTADGKATVFVNGKKACRISVKASAGSCKAKAPSRGRMVIDVSFAGSFSNGMKMFTSARLTRKVR
jgi:carbon monoxide dehydrogenase subunit G